MSTATAPIPLVLYPALARHQSNSNMITYSHASQTAACYCERGSSADAWWVLMLAVIYVFAICGVAAILYVSVDWFETNRRLALRSSS